MNLQKFVHTPVCLPKILEIMSKNISKRPLNILDATFGEGHYTRAFLGTI